MLIYKFLCVDREANSYKTEVLTIVAKNEDEARWQLSARWRWLFTIVKNLPYKQGGIYA